MLVSLFGTLCLFFLVYSYFGYPLVVYILGFVIKKKPVVSTTSQEGISIVIACRNEEGIIAEKLDNTLGLIWKGRPVSEHLLAPNSDLQVIVASDSSDDRTHEIVQSYKERGVELHSTLERNGKESAQKNSLQFVRNEIIVFTDAKIFLQEDVLTNISNHFKDQTIGAVSSRDRVVDEHGKSGEGAYVKYEMWVRRLETKMYSLVGLSGSCFAVRKQVTNNFPENIPSDFCMLIEARTQGLRGVHADNVIAEYRAVVSDQAEFNRKIRTVVRGMNSVWAYRINILKSEDKLLPFQIFSHKICRWLVPFFVIGAFLSSFILMLASGFWLTVFLGFLILFGLAFKGHLDPASRENILVKLCFFFTLTNLGIFFAWGKFLKGDSQVVWNPSQKG